MNVKNNSLNVQKIKYLPPKSSFKHENRALRHINNTTAISVLK